MTELADVRHNEGYSLAEVQQAFDAIEKELWQTVCGSAYEPRQVIDMLWELHRLMTTMRNQFAVSYAAKQVDVQKRMARLKERFFIYRHDRRGPESEADN